MLPHKQVPDASGLFNMMRNLGGAVGIALIDTVLYGRTSGHIEAIRQRLAAGDVATAQAIGLDRIPADLSTPGAAIEQAAFAASTNEAWAMMAAIAVLGLLLIPFARAGRSDAEIKARPVRTGSSRPFIYCAWGCFRFFRSTPPDEAVQRHLYVSPP